MTNLPNASMIKSLNDSIFYLIHTFGATDIPGLNS
jgi:hypothetical protein